MNPRLSDSFTFFHQASSFMSWGQGVVSGRRVALCHRLPGERETQSLESGSRFGTGHPDLGNLSNLRVRPSSSGSGSIRDDTQDTVGEENPGFSQLWGPQVQQTLNPGWLIGPLKEPGPSSLSLVREGVCPESPSFWFCARFQCCTCGIRDAWR